MLSCILKFWVCHGLYFVWFLNTAHEHEHSIVYIDSAMKVHKISWNVFYVTLTVSQERPDSSYRNHCQCTWHVNEIISLQCCWEMCVSILVPLQVACNMDTCQMNDMLVFVVSVLIKRLPCIQLCSCNKFNSLTSFELASQSEYCLIFAE